MCYEEKEISGGPTEREHSGGAFLKRHIYNET